MGEVVDFTGGKKRSFTIEVSWNDGGDQEIDVKDFYDHSVPPAEVFRHIAYKLMEAIGGLSTLAEQHDPSEEGPIAALVALHRSGSMRIGGSFANEEAEKRFSKIMNKLVDELNAETEEDMRGTRH